MTNLKKLALGLTVGAMAIGFSAFKSDVKVNRFATVYYQLAPGQYSKTPPVVGLDCEGDADPCTISFPNNIPAGTYDTFSYSQLSLVSGVGGTPSQSPERGYWQ